MANDLGFGNSSPAYSTNVRGITGWFIKKDIVRNRAQANMVMVALSIIFLIISIMIFVVSSFNSSGNTLEEDGYFVSDEIDWDTI